MMSSMHLRIPGKLDVALEFEKSDMVSNENAYDGMDVRRIAFGLVHALPPHVLIRLAREILMTMQDMAIRALREEASLRNQTLRLEVRDEGTGPMPGELHYQFSPRQPGGHSYGTADYVEEDEAPDVFPPGDDLEGDEE